MNKFLQEILEQPEAIERLLSHYSNAAGKKALDAINGAKSEQAFEQIIFTGMGSSYFVSHAAATLFNNLNIKAFAVNASELLHYNFSLLTGKTALVCASQSGESYEVVEVLKKLPPEVFCIGIVNEEESFLARKAGVALLCKSGKEEMTSTKTYVATSLAAFVMGWRLADQWDTDKQQMLAGLADNFASMLTDYKQGISDALEFMGDIQTLQIIARGPVCSTAFQSALMFKEALKIPATGISGGEFRHGPMEMVGPGFRAILFAGKGKTLAQSLKMAGDIAGFGGRVWLITNDRANADHPNIHSFYIDIEDEYLFSVQSIVPIQLFIDAYAKARGFEAGGFARGNKVTGIE